MNILIVDHEQSMCKAVGDRLRDEGFNVLVAGNGLDGLRLFYNEFPDVVVLDATTLQGGVFTICRRIREVTRIPIILLSATMPTEEEVVRGLEAGADDYLVKPLRLNEFVARIQALLRRGQMTKRNNLRYTDGYLSVDTQQQAVYVGGNRIHFTAIEFKLLHLLIQNAGRVVTHRELLEQVWGPAYITDIHYPRVYINHLRMKVEPDINHPIYIATEHRIGYRFEKRNSDVA